MTDQELQAAIDAAREFMNLSSTQGGILHQARENTRIHLKRLEEIQAVRAAAVTLPSDGNVSTSPKAGITAVAGACAMCHGSGLKVAGYTCPCKNITMFGGSHG